MQLKYRMKSTGVIRPKNARKWKYNAWQPVRAVIWNKHCGSSPPRGGPKNKNDKR